MKKNLLEGLLGILAPDYCYFCQRLGESVCKKCATDFKIRKRGADLFYFEIDDHESRLRPLIDEMKEFSRRGNARGLARVFANGILAREELRDNLRDLIFVGVPTSEKHQRQRGFCHTSLILENLQESLPISIGNEIERIGNFTQIGANREQRLTQAAESYRLKHPPQKGKIYIVLDDIHTTGATTQNIARILREGGAEKVYRMVAIIHQNNHKSPKHKNIPAE